MLVTLIIVGGIVALGLPAILLEHIEKKKKIEVSKLKIQKELLELEIKKKETEIIFLKEENKKLDKIIFEDNKMIEDQYK